MIQAGQRFQRIRRRHKLLGMLRLFRLPNLLMIFLGQLLVVWRYSDQSIPELLMMQPGLLAALFATQASAAGGYIVNDYHDVKIDSVNKPGRVVVGRLVTRRKALLSYFLLSGFALAAAVLAGKKAALLISLCCFLLWMYSARMKCMPLAGNFLVAGLVAVSLYLPVLFLPAAGAEVLLLPAFAFILNLVREMVKDMEDLRGDRQLGCQTFPVKFGIPAGRRFLWFCGGFLLLLYLPAFAVAGPAGRLLLLLSAVLCGIFYFRLQKADKKKDFTGLSRLLKMAMLAGMAGFAGW